MATFEPTEYQRRMFAAVVNMFRHIDPDLTPPSLDGQQDNGDGKNNVIIHAPGGVIITIPPEPPA